MKKILLPLLFVVCIGAAFLYAMQEKSNQMAVVQPKDLKWGPAPEVLPPGAEITVLYGNPFESGPYGLRLKFPANYRLGPHWHTLDENVTVISGDLYFGMGEKEDRQKATKIGVGGVAIIPGKMGHFAWTVEPTVVQLNNDGPFDIHYYNLADDPLQKKNGSSSR